MTTTEQLNSSSNTAVAEQSAPKPELTGKHLEAYFIKGVGYHKQRIMHAFGGGVELPALPRGDLADTFVASEKRYRKASDLLYRENPMEVPNPSDGISLDLVVALADNLAWKGIENSITTAHWDEVDKAIKQQGLSAKQVHSEQIVDLVAHQKALKSIMIEDGHFYRDFFDSELGEKFNLDSPVAIAQFLKRTSLTGNGSESITRKAKGIALEIAVKKYLANLFCERADEVSVNFGSKAEDKEGGDIVVILGGKILYIDLKSTRPGHGMGFAKDEIERGYRLYADNGKDIYKAIIWPESEDAVADDSFRLTDPSLKNGLQQVLTQVS